MGVSPTEIEFKCPDDARPAAVDKGVLVFNRDPELRVFLNKALYLGDLLVTWAQSREQLQASSESGEIGILLIGIDSPQSMAFLREQVEAKPDFPIVALARTATAELVYEVLQIGAADFIFGSIDVRTLVPRLRAILRRGARNSSDRLDASSGDSPSEQDRSGEGDDLHIVSCSKGMQRVLEIAETIAPTQSTALIQGESGTGKDLIAKRIHQRSKRQSRPFVEVNCGALPPNLLESQLFGHEKGSFTGAIQRQIGLFEVADKGTIFLDEIGEMSLDMQVKLLRVLQFREFRRVGGSKVVKVDVRVIAATNKDLAIEVEQKNFRADLFYRLNVIRLDIPPLRERPEEIPDLVRFFSVRFKEQQGLCGKRFSEGAIERLQKCSWKGNVRELENAVERLILLTKGDVVEVQDVEENLDGGVELAAESQFAPSLTLDEVKKIHIAGVLKANGGNKMKTARNLQINVKTLYNLIKSRGITVE